MSAGTQAMIALRIVVPGYAANGALPGLIDLLRTEGVGASFVFACGPDWLGRSLTRHCAATLHQVRDAAFDLGTYGWRPAQWVQHSAQASAAWLEDNLRRTLDSFAALFALPPQLHAAPGWCSHPHALRLTQRLGFACASDTRGRHPFIPVWNGEIVRCPQIPVTLPTLDELTAAPRQDSAAAIAAVLALTANPPPHGHVFSLQATRALARDLAPVRQLLDGWREQGYEVASIRSLASALVVAKLPRHEIVTGMVPGRKASVLLQGDEFLSAWKDAT